MRAYSTVNSPPWNSLAPGHYKVRIDVEQLTARTRRRDVLPAFCKPIMVMSISVALYAQFSVSQSFARHDKRVVLHRRGVAWLDGLEASISQASSRWRTHQNNRRR